MGSVGRLKQFFADGKLVSPAGPGPNLVDFSRALHSLAGAKDIVGAGFKPALTPEARALSQLIGPAEHYVFVLLDGLGRRTLDLAPAGGFLRPHLAGTLTTVFPSTTATALTALATGEHPGRHAVTGWWIWLAPPGVLAEVLPFVERFGRKSLAEFGVKPAEVFTVPSMVARLTHEPLAVMPADIAGSAYTRYCAGYTPTAGYREPAEALDLAARRVHEAERPSFTYVYLPDLDHASHEHGAGSAQAVGALARLDRLLAGFTERLAGRARLVVTGDHGLVDVPPERSLFLDEGDSLLDCLRAPPSGESTASYFHVKPGRADAFRAAFEARYGELFALVSTAEAEALGLFGPEPLSELARARVGDFVAVGWQPAALYYRQKSGPPPTVHRGAHAGLSPAEMRVPLILA